MRPALGWSKLGLGSNPEGGCGRELLAHLEVIDPADLPRFAQLGALADFQPAWAYPEEFIVELTQPAIGTERSEWLYPIGAVASAGGTLVFGSD